MSTYGPREAVALTQAMWDGMGILGFDLDGDPNPGATIAGMGIDGYIELFLSRMHQERADLDEACRWSADEATA